MNLENIQQEIRKQDLDGWLFFDHHLRDPLSYRVLGLNVAKGPTRRWYYMIPAHGEPQGMEHRIERNTLAGLPGEKIAYSSWTEQLAALKKLTAGLKRVAMQYSPMCAIPYVSTVDAGTVELVRSLGVDVVSSAELIQVFEARWSPDALNRIWKPAAAWTVCAPRPSSSFASAPATERRCRKWKCRPSCATVSPRPVSSPTAAPSWAATPTPPTRITSPAKK